MKVVGLLVVAVVAAVMVGQSESGIIPPVVNAVVDAIFNTLITIGSLTLRFGPDFFDAVHSSPYCPLNFLEAIVKDFLAAFDNGNAYEMVKVLKTATMV